MRNFFVFAAALLLSNFALATVPASTPRLSQERIVVRTNFGDMAIALYPDVAPKHTDQILKLVKLGVYDGIGIYRIEKGFVAQIDDHVRRNPQLSDRQWDAVKKIDAEFSEIKHRRGLVSMARHDDVNSAETSFSFMLGDAPHLDGKYTVVGQVVEGMDVLDRIEKMEVDSGNVPKTLLEISKAEVVDAGDLKSAQLSAAHDYEAPNAVARKLFLIFACVAFTTTVIWPILGLQIRRV